MMGVVCGVFAKKGIMACPKSGFGILHKELFFCHTAFVLTHVSTSAISAFTNTRRAARQPFSRFVLFSFLTGHARSCNIYLHYNRCLVAARRSSPIYRSIAVLQLFCIDISLQATKLCLGRFRYSSDLN